MNLYWDIQRKKAELQAEEQIEKKDQHKKESPRKIDEDERILF